MFCTITKGAVGKTIIVFLYTLNVTKPSTFTYLWYVAVEIMTFFAGYEQELFDFASVLIYTICSFGEIFNTTAAESMWFFIW